MTVDLILERLLALHPKKIDLVLDRVHRLLDILGNPELQLPPVIHVAGTNGKGSTLAFMRAVAEAAGISTHVYTSPHLVRFNERIRLNGRLISDDALQALLTECEEANGGEPITFFEITTVAAILAFARQKADLLLLEVGLGGRLDATNVISRPLASVITPVSMDHQEFLGSDIAKIAFEKAGIIKPGAPAVIGHQEPEAQAVMEAQAEKQGAPLIIVDRDWQVERRADGWTFIQDGERIDLPLPSLQGPHQIDNAALAIAAMRAARLDVSADAMASGIGSAIWPARLQRIQGTGLAEDVLIDGGHNPAAAKALAAAIDVMPGQPTHMIMGLLANRSPTDFLAPLKGRIDEIVAVPMGGHDCHPPEVIADAAKGLGIHARTATDINAALDELRAMPFKGRLLIGGSLYLAGEALAALKQYPD